MKFKDFSNLVLIAALAFVAGCGNRQNTKATRNGGGGTDDASIPISISGAGIAAAGLFITEQNPADPDYGNGIEPEPYWGMGDDTVCGQVGAIRMASAGMGEFTASVEIERVTRNIINIVYCLTPTGPAIWTAFGAGSTLQVRDGITVTVRSSPSASPTNIGSFLVSNGIGGANFSITISNDGVVSFGGGATGGGGGGGGGSGGSSTVAIRFITSQATAPELGGEFDSYMLWSDGYERTMGAITGGYQYTFTGVNLSQDIPCPGAGSLGQHICLTFNAVIIGGYAVDHTGIHGGTWSISINGGAFTTLTSGNLMHDPNNFRVGVRSSGVLDTTP